MSMAPGGSCPPTKLRNVRGLNMMSVMSESRQSGPKPRAFDKRSLLLAHPLFGRLGPELVDRLSSYAMTKSAKRGATIFAKGDPGTSLFAVCTGSVKITAPSAEGKDTVFNLLKEGDIFGEIALLDGRPRTADAIAATDCELLVIERRNFIPLVHSHPEIALKLIEVLCERIRRTSEQVEDVTFLDLPTRLAKVLLRLAAGAKSSEEGGMIHITQREIGQMIGMSRESTNKQLRSWEQRKWLRLERGGIVLLAPKALATVAAAGVEIE
jgi:CRP/FNR family transcriptional regulator, cyclic AMP receptor protein